ncbi:MAG TPA: hypothetical protein VK857_01025 [Desulforhopalus sp.]|nr:hypothetical protein [Desulforhopalus sp.]
MEQTLPAATNHRKHLYPMLFSCIAALLAGVLYWNFFINRAYVEVELNVESTTDFKIYWAKAGQLFSEKNMAVAIVSPEKSRYGFFLTDIGKIERLRIDTHRYTGEAQLKSLTLHQEGWHQLMLKGTEDFRQLQPLTDIAEYRIDDDGLWVSSSGEDPNFELLVNLDRSGIDRIWLIFRLMLLVLLVFSMTYAGAFLIDELRFVPVLLFAVLVLVIVMAGISKRNAHPDEYVHLDAAAYYQDHWLPPVVDDPDIRHTYSIYGISRLNSGEVYYLFVGKFHRFLEAFQLSEHLSLRLLNVVLLGLIFAATLRCRYARMVALPVLISPQIWYLFSYCNSDGFALFIAFVAAWQLVAPGSLLHRYLLGNSWWTVILGGLAIGLLLGLVLLLKKNYYPFLAFWFLSLAAMLFFSNEYKWLWGKALRRLLVVGVIALVVFGLRIGADSFVNGVDRQAKLLEMREELAQDRYKPSTPLDEKHISLYRKARGVTLENVVVIDRWFEKTFRSSFGVYGYFTISAPNVYYDLVRWSGAALLVFLFCSIFLRGGLVGSTLAVGALTLSATLIGVSLYHSWSSDFQAQGRYLFPILPMLSILYAWNYQAVNRQVLALGVGALYLLGLYSFIFQALLRIPRTDG